MAAVVCLSITRLVDDECQGLSENGEALAAFRPSSASHNAFLQLPTLFLCERTFLGTGDVMSFKYLLLP